MLAMVPAKPVPAHVLALGGATWLYEVQHISPITQLIPWRRVRRVVVIGFIAWQAAYVVSELTKPAGENTSESDRASESFASVPRIFSLKNAVLLRPSVTLAMRTALRK